MDVASAQARAGRAQALARDLAAAALAVLIQVCFQLALCQSAKTAVVWLWDTSPLSMLAKALVFVSHAARLRCCL